MINKKTQPLIDQLIKDQITMVEDNRFQTVVRNFDKINSVAGDIIECGCWRGGFSIFLSHVFQDRNVWVCDSFCGFQPLSMSKYPYSYERHTEAFTMSHAGPIGVPLESVMDNFSKFHLEKEERIRFVPGFVQYSLPQIKQKIDSIALLRIDVDSYSATLECLDNLYDKVSSGGYIIFDDSSLHETLDAIKTFVAREKLENYIYHPDNDEKLDLDVFSLQQRSWPPPGCYIVKK